MRSMVEGPSDSEEPLTALRAVPLPEKSRGGIKKRRPAPPVIGSENGARHQFTADRIGLGAAARAALVRTKITKCTKGPNLRPRSPLSRRSGKKSQDGFAAPALCALVIFVRTKITGPMPREVLRGSRGPTPRGSLNKAGISRALSLPRDSGRVNVPECSSPSASPPPSFRPISRGSARRCAPSTRPGRTGSMST